MARDVRGQQATSAASPEQLQEQQQQEQKQRSPPTEAISIARNLPQAESAGFVVPSSTLANLAVHSLLMVTLPFALFFASHLGGLDGNQLLNVAF